MFSVIKHLQKSTLFCYPAHAVREKRNMVLLRFFLFGMSTIGTFELIRKACNDKVNIYFLPSLTIAIQVSVLFLAGILNLLPEVTIGLYLIGFAGIIYSFYERKNLTFIKAYINIGYMVLLILLLIFTIYLKGKKFSNYDTFSHWGTVVRRMLDMNRYPNFNDAFIMFKEYPLGSSTYIYYFARLVSTSESIQMLAQSYMILAAVLPLYSFAQKNQLAISVISVSFINYVLLYNTVITKLCVDTLLPLVGISGILFTYLHCKDGKKIMYYFAAFYMVLLIQIKNSGIFFTAIIAVQLIIFARKSRECLHGGISIALPFISFILWHKHCKYVFYSAATSKHAMTVENFKRVFEAKTKENIMQICDSFLKFTFTYKELWITVGIGALIGVLIFLMNKEKFGKVFLKTAAFSLVIYVTYQIGMLAMYLFSMPGKEATDLSSIERYTKTILIAILYLNMVPAMLLIAQLNGKRAKTIITTGCIFTSFFAGMYISSGSITTVVQDKPDASERNWFENAALTYSVRMYESYCNLIPSDDSGYAYYLGRYLFQSDAITSKVIESEDDLNDITSKYIFVYDQNNEIIQNWILENYPEQLGNEVIIQN